MAIDSVANQWRTFYYAPIAGNDTGTILWLSMPGRPPLTTKDI
ncbi:hypothetical protein A464_2474 [Salmonella bongori N268-08]|uniref:Uncharacterized protein n=1 Tax=Salmonella bongori N268-08 TaxID=1197719 RepID=S5MYI0_SALBN|nr:hypothetical protein A464_2474 [Salmonella bongori N268-08]